MTTPAVNPVLTVHKLYQADTVGSLLDPLYAFFEYLQESFTMPIIGDNVTLKVADSSKYAIGASVWINGIGFLDIIGLPDSTHLYIQNNDADGNANAGTTMPVGTVFAFAPPKGTAASQSFNLTDTLAQDFTTPSGTADGNMYVSNGSWYKVGMQVFVPGGGYYRITNYDSPTNMLTVKNAGIDNATGGTTIAAGTVVFPQQCGMMMPDNGPAEQEGITANQTLSANNYASPCAVVFPTAFTTAPTVVHLTMYSAGDAGSVGKTNFYATAITTTGFNIVWDSDLTATVKFMWRARR